MKITLMKMKNGEPGFAALHLFSYLKYILHEINDFLLLIVYCMHTVYYSTTS